MDAAQFKLTYDSSRFEFKSVSAGEYDASTNMFVYLSYSGQKDRGSITFTFKAKSTGTGTFNISEPVLSSSSSAIGTRAVSVTVVQASNSGTTKPNTGTTKPKPNKNTNTNQNPDTNAVQEPEPEVIIKTELEQVLVAINELVQTDYTPESWSELQGAIEKAQNANTNAEYDEIKGKLTVDNLVVADFEKNELMNMLIELMGKSQKDYTEESWKQLQSAIVEAQNAKLKSEYDKVKDKLKVDTLAKKEGVKEFIENFIQGLERKDPFYLAFAGCIIVLLLVILILIIVICRGRKDRRSDYSAKRMR